MSDDRISDAEKVFLGVLLFLVLKGLLDPKDEDAKARVKREWLRTKGGEKPPAAPLFEGFKLW